MASEVSSPLGNDHPVHIAEENEQKDDLRNELEEKVHLLLEVNRVGSLHANTKTHLKDTKDNRELHLERV